MSAERAAVTTAAASSSLCCRGASVCSSKSRAIASANCVPAARPWLAPSKPCSSAGIRATLARRNLLRRKCDSIVPDDSQESIPSARSNRQTPVQPEELGDFTTTSRVIPISCLAMLIGVACAFVALALLRLIGLFTNLFYFGRWNTAMVSPAGNHLGIYSVLVPIGGALIVGVMARYGSERIRGHGIPEA